MIHVLFTIIIYDYNLQSSTTNFDCGYREKCCQQKSRKFRDTSSSTGERKERPEPRCAVVYTVQWLSISSYYLSEIGRSLQ